MIFNRPPRIEQGSHSSVQLGGEIRKLSGRPIRRLSAQTEALEHQPADNLMRAVKWDALAGQRLCQLGRRSPALPRGCFGPFFVQTNRSGDGHSHLHGRRELFGGVEDGFLVLL